MDRRAFLLSLCLASLAMYLVWQSVTTEEKRLEALYGKATSQAITVATRDILQFESIRPTDLETITVPAAMIPPGFIANPKDVLDAVAAVPIAKGEQILDNKIISRNIYSGLDTQISLGKRAISIPVNVKSSLGFNVKPGNRVDLAAHFEYKSTGIAISEVKVFMQDILVLASGRTIQSDPPKAVDQEMIRNAVVAQKLNDPREAEETLNHAKQESNFNTVTLEVTANQAQIIVYVLTVFGDSINLMLRNTDDRQLARSGTTNLIEIMGPDSFMVRGRKLPPPRAVPRAKFFDYLGGDRSAVFQ